MTGVPLKVKDFDVADRKDAYGKATGVAVIAGQAEGPRKRATAAAPHEIRNKAILDNAHSGIAPLTAVYSTGERSDAEVIDSAKTMCRD